MARKHLNILVAGGFTWKEDLEVPEKQIIQFGRKGATALRVLWRIGQGSSYCGVGPIR